MGIDKKFYYVYEYVRFFTKKFARFSYRKMNRMKKSINKEIKNIVICCPQVLFSKGGAEDHVNSLSSELRKRGFFTDIVNLPYTWYPQNDLLKSIEAWKNLNLNKCCGKNVDLVITTKFPSYFVNHNNKVLWLIHQFRQVYDLFGTEYSEYGPLSKNDLKLKEKIKLLDAEAIVKHRRCFTNSQNTSKRLKKFNSIDAKPLYHPPKLYDKYNCTSYGDYILSVGRLDKLKRIDLLLKSLKITDNRIKCKIAGSGSCEAELKRLAYDLGISDRVEFLGYVSDEMLIRLYSESFAVYFAPFDEDYGYITLEAFLSKKPVITAFDSGGPLEFVTNNENGYVSDSIDPTQIAFYIRQLADDKMKCKTMGEKGFQCVKDISWNHAISSLICNKL